MNETSRPESESFHLALRESLARILARAVLQLRPGTKLGGGAATDDGFYYDFALSAPLQPDDFPAIERAMRGLIARADSVEGQQLLAAEAAELDQPFLAALAAADGGEGESGRAGDHSDRLRLPLMAAEIPGDSFALRSLGGAYFQGDASNAMLTRIYAFAERSRAALADRMIAHERAAQRDHKKLGRELELFTFDDEIGPGLPIWLPNGTVIRDELETLMRELEWDAGFERVVTPPIARQELYFRTGHLPYYAESMFPSMRSDAGDAALFSLRPMNCPHHHKVFASKRRGHRELPLRISEYGNVFRYEDSGAVSGLLRTRAMCMNDAHIYCAPDQVMAELRAV
ncbi:MAG TPA: aminoacyl--tRNA ligase-related protein, partial [Polyangiales bacterium]